MQIITKEKIEKILLEILPAENFSAITVNGGTIGFVLSVEPNEKNQLQNIEQKCRQKLESVIGVEKIHIVSTLHSSQKIEPRENSPYKEARQRAVWNVTPVDGVKNIIAIASGKGGVGKSTTTVNIARAFSKQGKKIAIFDADIYGPSIPLMLGLKEKGRPEIENGLMLPYFSDGIATMSIGFITGDEAAILRGPMISKTLQQMLRATSWKEIDILFIDMPPGTGDVPLSIAQQVPVNGVVLVTTPQEVAVIDALKCGKMFEKLGIPIVGVIENMSYFKDSSGANINIFGSGGGNKLASEFKTKLLAQIPLNEALRSCSDSGTSVFEIPDSDIIEVYQHAAAALCY